jgi:aspartate oxidase
VTNDKLVEKLYAARKQLARLIIRISPEPGEVKQLETLLERQNELVAQINRLNLSALVASTAGIAKATDEIDKATKKLKALTAKAHSIAKAIAVADKVIAIAAAIATKL